MPVASQGQFFFDIKYWVFHTEIVGYLGIYGIKHIYNNFILEKYVTYIINQFLEIWKYPSNIYLLLCIKTASEFLRIICLPIIVQSKMIWPVLKGC
jgi:hypothetical protein